MGDVVTELRDAVLTVTLHRPGRLNALSLSLQRELAELWARVRRDAGVRCIVVTGSGRAFCAGADVADLAAMTAPAGGDRGRIEFCPGACVDVPVIAAVNGPCLGAGLRLLADADLAIASDLAWFTLFLALSVLMFGSMFVSIGAACSDIKDAQGMMAPAMTLMMLPWMTWFAVLNAPESPMAVGLSLFPTATPFLMLLRIALPPGPPMWQVALGVSLTAATAMGMAYAAGKIFRTGLLMQGKGATLGEMWRWVRSS